MFVAYTAKIRGIIECWQCYGVCEDYNGIVSKVLGDGWLNPRILSVQSLEAHHPPLTLFCFRSIAWSVRSWR